jgi:hypothetical protein
VGGAVVEEVAHLVVERVPGCHGKLVVHRVGIDVDREVVRLDDVEDVGGRRNVHLDVVSASQMADHRRHGARAEARDRNRIDDLGGTSSR